MDCGSLTVDQSAITYQKGLGNPVEIPVIPVLIDTDDGYILFDTGLDPAGLSSPEEVWGIKKKVVRRFSEENDIRHQLDLIGVKPEDIRYVVNSHFHWDHTGGNRFFSEATFFVQKSEYRFGYYPDSFVESLYIKPHFDHPLNYQLIEGDYEVVEGVYIITTPGHTPGHQSLVVQMPDETAILMADAVYSKENYDLDIPPGNTWDITKAIESMNKLKYLAKMTDGNMYITHDPNFWKDHKPSFAYK